MPDAAQLRFAEYTRADLDSMFRLDELCFAETFRFSRAQMRRYAEAREAQVALAFAGELLAGFSIVHIERARTPAKLPYGYLLTLDVAPDRRRCGLASALLQQAEQRAASAGCAAMVLHVFTENEAAVALYERRGYARLGAHTAFYGAGRDAWVYRRELAGPTTG